MADWDIEEGAEIYLRLEHIGYNDEGFAANLLGEAVVNRITAIDGINEKFLGLIHELTIMVDGEIVDVANPATVIVDLTTLGLTTEQKIRLVGFVFDEETGTYIVLPGALIESGTTFAFELNGSGIVGIMVYTMPHIFMRLTIGDHEYYLNGATLQSDVAPFIEQSRTLVPLRIVAEALGGRPRWDGANRVAYLYFDDITLRLPMGVALPDGLGMPVLLSGRVFVPLRYVSQMIGAKAFWDSTNRAVYVWQRYGV